jgi:quinohemoprotein ethanol dehydrogenase
MKSCHLSAIRENMTSYSRMLLTLSLTVCIAGCSYSSPEAPAATVDGPRILRANPADWLSTGRTYDEQRFSPLHQIDTHTVSRLGLVGYRDFDTRMGQEATPIVVDGTMYVSTDWSIVEAIDAQSGRLLWHYDPEARAALVKGCCGPVNRGVAVWKGKVFVGTLDGRLVALDAASGKPVWQVQTTDPTKPYTITGAPRIIKDKVIIGNGGAEMGVRGFVSAYDTLTGELVWRFYTVPGKPGTVDGAASDAAMRRLAGPTWNGAFWKQGGGGTVWDSMAYDPALDLLYIGTGNGSPWNPARRSEDKGDNLFLASIIALRPDTGEYVWHYQTTPAEAWDFTATQHMILADLTIAGKTRKVLMQAPKNGFFYILDRTTGKLISAKPIVPITWAHEVDLTSGRPVENPGARYYRTGKPFLMAPAGNGAHNWQPMSFNPQTGLVYIPVQQFPFAYTDANKEQFGPKKFNLGVGYSYPKLPPNLRPAGWLAAWDPLAGKERWRVSYATPVNGGVLSTAGGIVFQGQANGEFAAYSAISGRKLWRFDAQAGIVAAPVTYSIGHDQYVAIMVGWGGVLAMAGGVGPASAIGPNRLLIFRIGGNLALPPKELREVIGTDLSTTAFSVRKASEGASDFMVYCARCHNLSTAPMAGTLAPSLRQSGYLANRDAFNAVVDNGALAGEGMPGFRDVLKPAQIEAIRNYLIQESSKNHRR